MHSPRLSGKAAFRRRRDTRNLSLTFRETFLRACAAKWSRKCSGLIFGGAGSDIYVAFGFDDMGIARTAEHFTNSQQLPPDMILALCNTIAADWAPAPRMVGLFPPIGNRKSASPAIEFRAWRSGKYPAGASRSWTYFEPALQIDVNQFGKQSAVGARRGKRRRVRLLTGLPGLLKAQDMISRR